MVQTLGVEPSSLGLQPSALTTRAKFAWGVEGGLNSPLKVPQTSVLTTTLSTPLVEELGIGPSLSACKADVLTIITIPPWCVLQVSNLTSPCGRQLYRLPRVLNGIRTHMEPLRGVEPRFQVYKTRTSPPMFKGPGGSKENRTPASPVTGGRTNHYTMDPWQERSDSNRDLRVWSP